ncbi:hypothetical protein VXO91_18640, partial [Escherichia coli]|nr:hypothetical protein [Escherichia coli]
MIDYKKNLLFILVFISGFILFTVYSYTAEKMIYNETCTANWVIFNDGNDSNLLIVFYVQIMPDDFVMQLHR